MTYIVYDEKGKILRTVHCSVKLSFLQAGDGEFVMEGIADDVTQKVINVGIAGVVVDKTPAEIEAEKPPGPIPVEQQKANITNEQWQEILSRIEKLENPQKNNVGE